jgi:hypothetical protein
LPDRVRGEFDCYPGRFSGGLRNRAVAIPKTAPILSRAGPR